MKSAGGKWSDAGGGAGRGAGDGGWTSGAGRGGCRANARATSSCWPESRCTVNGAGWSARRNVASVDGRRSENATSGGARETDESEDSVAPWFAVFDGARQAVMTATGWAVLRQSARRSGAGRVGAGGARVRRRAVDCTSWRAEDRIVWWRRTLVKAELRRRRRAHAQVSENSSRKQIAAQTFEAAFWSRWYRISPYGEAKSRTGRSHSGAASFCPCRRVLVSSSYLNGPQTSHS